MDSSGVARIIQRGRLALRNGPWSWLSPPPAIVSLHCLVTDNVGDRVSPPALYFDFLRQAVAHDLMFVPRRVSRGARVMVFGGGGLLDHGYFTKGWKSVLGNTAAELVAWGLGHNRHGGPGGRHPDFLRQFQLVGVRDWGPDVPSSFDWVPCASCMHAAFDAPAEIVHEVAYYSHERFRLMADGIPRLSNNEGDVSKVVRFLASAETVVTNSYHGMYWATLLGRKVVALPFSSKFHSFRYPVALATPEDWKSACRGARAFPEALQECRAANRAFAEKVRHRLDALGL